MASLANEHGIDAFLVAGQPGIGLLLCRQTLIFHQASPTSCFGFLYGALRLSFLQRCKLEKGAPSHSTKVAPTSSRSWGLTNVMAGYGRSIAVGFGLLSIQTRTLRNLREYSYTDHYSSSLNASLSPASSVVHESQLRILLHQEVDFLGGSPSVSKSTSGTSTTVTFFAAARSSELGSPHRTPALVLVWRVGSIPQRSGLPCMQPPSTRPMLLIKFG